jgi:hypothetical protein
MRLRQVGHARLGTAQCDLRRCDYFLLLTHACPSVECAIGRELTAPCAPWLAAAAPEKERKREPTTVGAMCVSSALHPCINIKYRKPVPGGVRGRRPVVEVSRTTSSRDAAPTISRGKRNGRRDARGVGGNRTQRRRRRRQMRRRRAGSSSRGAGCGRQGRQGPGGHAGRDAGTRRPRNYLSREC